MHFMFWKQKIEYSKNNMHDLPLTDKHTRGCSQDLSKFV